ncbi:coadhesin-like [Rhopilema esculentum]|uniref:coadhesin-like n=1 Tax=Rhopilema esculentum TaxID=499914 RepID=UPI0031D60A35
MQSLLAVIIIGLIASAIGTNQCSTKYLKAGCFRDEHDGDSPLQDLILTRRDWADDRFDGTLIDWKNYDTSLHLLYCKCAELAKRMGYTYFGLQFYGECWSGNSNSSSKLESIFKFRSDECIEGSFAKCDTESKRECIGKSHANFIYKLKLEKAKKIINGGYTEWSEWSHCCRSCGGGSKVRVRSCTNPAPSLDGNDCSQLGPAIEIGTCNNHGCAEACRQAMDLGIIIDASRHVKRRNFMKIKRLVSKLSDDLEISTEGSHMGIIHYAKFPYIDFTPRDVLYHDRKQCRSKIASIIFTNGGNRLDRALRAAESDFFCDLCIRRGVPQALLVITTGKTGPKSEDLALASAKMKAKGVTIIAVGVGKKLRSDQLKKIASEPAKKHVFKIGTFDGLKLKLNEILQSACNGRAA